MIVLATGSRELKDKYLVYEVLSGLIEDYGNDFLVVQGGARGADSFVQDCCSMLHINCKTVKPDWKKYGRAAGVLRNQEMLDTYKPNLVIAFLSPTAANRGTKDMIARAEKAKIVVMTYIEDNQPLI